MRSNISPTPTTFAGTWLAIQSHPSASAVTKMPTKTSQSSSSVQNQSSHLSTVTDTVDRLSAADVVYVEVGTVESKTFVVHRETICQQSPFFKSSLHERDPGKGKQIIQLPEVDPRMFEEYLSWMYTKTTKLDTIADDITRKAGSRCRSAKYIRVLVDFYLLGQDLEDYGFQNRASEYLHKLDSIIIMNMTHDPMLITHIASHTPAEQSILRRWMMRHLVKNVTRASFPAHELNEWPHDVLVSVLCKMGAGEQGNNGTAQG